MHSLSVYYAAGLRFDGGHFLHFQICTMALGSETSGELFCYRACFVCMPSGL